MAAPDKKSEDSWDIPKWAGTDVSRPEKGASRLYKLANDVAALKAITIYIATLKSSLFILQDVRDCKSAVILFLPNILPSGFAIRHPLKSELVGTAWKNYSKV